MRILILGGTGVLSTDVVNEVVSHKDDLYVLNRGNHSQLVNSRNFHTIIGDIRNPNDISEKIGNMSFDVVVDFLSYTPNQIESTYRIFSHLCKQFIFISSCCVFRRGKEDGLITEDSYRPSELSYGKNKYLCEEKLKELSCGKECVYTIVRPYITYGDTRLPVPLAPIARYHWTIIGRILSDKPFFVWEDSSFCTLLRTEDFAKIFYYLLLNKKAYNQDVNLTGKERYTWKQVISTIFLTLGKDPSKLIYIPKDYIAEALPSFKDFLLLDRSRDAVFDITKLITIVPEADIYLDNSISLEDGIRKVVDYYIKHNLRCVDYIYDAQVDRMISNYIKCNKGEKYNLHYADYGNNGTIRDRLYYFIYRYFDYKTISKIKKMKFKL